MALPRHPSQVLTDSLCSLQLLRGWHQYPLSRVLRCDLRGLVRQVLALACQCPQPPLLEKVQAHNEAWIRLGHPKAVGNDQADFWAKKAATEPGHRHWGPTPSQYGDAVEILRPDGTIIWNVADAFPSAWWQHSRQTWAARGPRPRLDTLFPLTSQFDWSASNGVFRRAVSGASSFVHPVAPAVIKWLGRVRCGCLATQERLHRHHMGAPSATCL